MKSEVKMSGTRLQITRVFEAPRAMVFGYGTQVEKPQQWAGCEVGSPGTELEFAL